MAHWDAIKWTPEQDAEILRVYRAGEYGGCKRLAVKWGISEARVSYRAAILGLPSLICGKASSPSKKYSPAEMEIIRKHCTDPVAQIRARLYRAGFYRSLASIRGALVDALSYLPKKTYRKVSCAASSTKNRLAAVLAPVTAG